MKTSASTIGLTALGIVLLTACGSGSDESTGQGDLDPQAYCSTVAPLWDSTAIPNYDDDLSGAERATAVADFSAALDALPQGVALGAFTEPQADLLAKGFSVYLALYEDPALASADPSAAAEAAGLSEAEFAELNSPDNTEVQAAVEALMAYCQPGSGSMPSEAAVEE